MIRLLSWNIRSLRDSRGDVVDVIRAAEADVVCLQEAPRVLASWRAGRLARDCGLQVATAGAPVGGLALLVGPRVRVVATIRAALPWTPGLHRRGLARVVAEVDGHRLQVGTFHLGLRAAERERHARIVTSWLGSSALPRIAAGDVNETEAAPAWATFLLGHHDAWRMAGEGDGRTFSTANPRRRIDAVFVDRRLAVTSCEVIESDAVARASDHRPVVVDVRWPTDTLRLDARALPMSELS